MFLRGMRTSGRTNFRLGSTEPGPFLSNKRLVHNPRLKQTLQDNQAANSVLPASLANGPVLVVAQAAGKASRKGVGRDERFACNPVAKLLDLVVWRRSLDAGKDSCHPA